MIYLHNLDIESSTTIITDNLEDTEPNGFCLLCSIANLNSNVKFSAFGCDPIGLCGTKYYLNMLIF